MNQPWQIYSRLTPQEPQSIPLCNHPCALDKRIARLALLIYLPQPRSAANPAPPSPRLCQSHYPPARARDAARANAIEIYKAKGQIANPAFLQLQPHPRDGAYGDSKICLEVMLIFSRFCLATSTKQLSGISCLAVALAVGAYYLASGSDNNRAALRATANKITCRAVRRCFHDMQPP